MNKGLPRSGKSTGAKKFVEASGNAVIVSRDDLRIMLHDGKWTPRNEKTTINVQKAIVKALLAEGKVVIVDDTNLTDAHRQRWEQFAKECNAGFEVKHYKESNLKTLIDRDNKSETRRGADVIIKMAMQNDYVHFPDKSVVICDIDGTVADLNHRRHLSRPGPQKNWDEFFRLAPLDTPIHSTIGAIKDHAADGKTIIFVSARPERCRKDTEQWLLRQNLAPSHMLDDKNRIDDDEEYTPYFALLMRADGDSRDDIETKQEILDKYLKKDWILKVYDDRPKVIRMWRENGLEVEDVGDGEEF